MSINHCLDTQYGTHQVNPQRWNVAAQAAGELKLVTDTIYLPENQVQKKTRNKYVNGPHSCQNYLRVFKFQHTESEVEAKCQDSLDRPTAPEISASGTRDIR